MLTRRHFVGGLGSASLLCSTGIPGISFANVPTDKRFVLVILRGGMDGIAAVPPYDDRYYEEVRRGLDLPAPGGIGDGVIDLDGFFGLHPALEPMKSLYDKKELAIYHAVASPYRQRSHFDGQNVLENGTDKPNGANNGWLNRSLEVLVPESYNKSLGLAVSQQIPLVLQGRAKATSWAPMPRKMDVGEDFINKMSKLYRNDKYLGKAFYEAVRTREMIESSMPKDDQMAGKGAFKANKFDSLVRPVISLLSDPLGPRVVVMETSGWDTHANQGTVQGKLSNNFEGLAKGINSLRSQLGSIWNKTVIVVVTEFGRTAHMNGTGGTDHGTAGVSFVAGGSVNGGRVLGRWPGLKNTNLYEGRDLMPTTDMRSIFKTILVRHLGLGAGQVNASVFPDSGSATVSFDLIS